MYDGSGTFAIKVGIPTKSGVGGGLLSVSDKRAGIGVFGPALDAQGNSIGSFSVSGSPTGIAYSQIDDSLWVLTYAGSNNIIRVNKTGTVQEQYTFGYSDTLDQCFFDYIRGYLYITAGANYTSRNNVYLFNTKTHAQSIACTVDSYSVEGIWLGDGNKMIIVNDGYYHSATVAVNQANFYTIE
jgi:hypothetical protein